MKKLNVVLLALLTSLSLGMASMSAHSQDKAAAKPVATKSAEPLDINTASVKELEALNGVGPVRAAAIVKGRPYRGKNELLDKKIVPENVYNDIKDKIVAKQAK